MYILLARLTVFMMILIIIRGITKINQDAKHHTISRILKDIVEMLIFYIAIVILLIISSFLLIRNADTVMYYYHSNNIAAPIIIFIAAILNIIKTHTH